MKLASPTVSRLVTAKTFLFQLRVPGGAGPQSRQPWWSVGDPKRSELFLGMNHRGPGQMPNLATSFVDEKAALEIAAWIESLSAAR